VHMGNTRAHERTHAHVRTHARMNAHTTKHERARTRARAHATKHTRTQNEARTRARAHARTTKRRARAVAALGGLRTSQTSVEPGTHSASPDRTCADDTRATGRCAATQNLPATQRRCRACALSCVLFYVPCPCPRRFRAIARCWLIRKQQHAGSVGMGGGDTVPVAWGREWVTRNERSLVPASHAGP
jgi:hypothetical protein